MRGRAARSRASRKRAAMRSRSSRIGPTSGGDCERGKRQRGGQRRERRRMLALFKLGGDVTAGERVADSRAGEAEHLRERPDHDDAVLDQVDCASRPSTRSRPRRRRAAARRELAELAGRVVRAAADRQRRVLVADLGTGDPDRDREHRVGRVVRDRDACRRGRRTSASRAGSGRRRRHRARRSPARRPRSRRSPARAVG